MSSYIGNIEKADFRCAIYGPANSFSKPDFEEKMSQIRNAILDLISKGVTTFITSAHDGFELSSATFIKELKRDNPNLKLVIVRPFPGKETNWHTAPILRSVEKAADMVKYFVDNESDFQQIEMDKWIVSHCSSIIYAYGGKKPSLNRLSKIDLTDKTVIYVPALVKGSPDVSLQYPFNLIMELFGEELSEDQLSLITEEMLDNAIGNRLTDREFLILQERYVDNKTLQVIGKEFGVTRERIRQLLNKAKRKIKVRIKRDLKAFNLSYDNKKPSNTSENATESLEEVVAVSEEDNREIDIKKDAKKYADWAEEFPNHVVLLHAGYYSAWGRSAEVLNEILDYKLAYLKTTNTPFTGGTSLEIIINALEANHLNYVVVDDGEVTEKKEFEYCDEIFYRPEDFMNTSKADKEETLSKEEKSSDADKFSDGEEYSDEEKLQAIEALLDGVNPITGEIVEEDHLINEGLIQDVLMFARNAIIRKQKREAKQKPQTGARWTEEEDEQLEEEFRSGLSIKEIAEAHERTEGAIRSRLARKGLIEL